MSENTFKQSVSQLTENFSELEADMPKELYDALAPQIQQITNQYQEFIKSSEDGNRVNRLIKILTGNPRVLINERSLKELEDLLDDTHSRTFNTTSWNFTLTVNQAVGAEAVNPPPVAPQAGRVAFVTSDSYNQARSRGWIDAHFVRANIQVAAIPTILNTTMYEKLRRARDQIAEEATQRRPDPFRTAINVGRAIGGMRTADRNPTQVIVDDLVGDRDE